MSEQQWVGIDVCQKYLDVYIRPLSKLFQVTNNEMGITQLVQTLVEIQPELIVLEAERRNGNQRSHQANSSRISCSSY